MTGKALVGDLRLEALEQDVQASRGADRDAPHRHERFELEPVQSVKEVALGVAPGDLDGDDGKLDQALVVQASDDRARR